MFNDLMFQVDNYKKSCECYENGDYYGQLEYLNKMADCVVIKIQKEICKASIEEEEEENERSSEDDSYEDDSYEDDSEDDSYDDDSEDDSYEDDSYDDYDSSDYSS